MREFRMERRQQGAEPINVALGKAATQSSHFMRFPVEVNATNGIKNGDCSFHTDIEDSPWWQVDLGNHYFVDRIVIYNRMLSKERASSLVVKMGPSLFMLLTVHKQKGQVFGGVDGNPAIVQLEGRKARYVKICLESRDYLHLDEVEVFGTREPAYQR